MSPSLMRDRALPRAGRRRRLALSACLAGGLAALACVVAPAAEASERGRAERLYSRGLGELHDGHHDAAIALFQQAVAEDPKDMRALYYRGLGYGRAGRYEESVADLRAVVAAGDPTIERDRLELGYALYRLERYDEAAAELEVASQKGRSAGEATLLLGIVESRRGNHAAAQAALDRVAGMDPGKTVAARYYQGLAAYRAGDNTAATEHFTVVARDGGDGPFASEAQAFLDSMSEGTGNKPWRLHAGLAFEYDSNVALAPDDDNLAQNVYGVSDRSDGRAVITAGGRYALVSTPKLRIAAGYDFLQSLHFDLERFDIQTHKLGAQAEYALGIVSLGLAASYEHSLLDEESLLNGGTVLPWVRVDEGDFGRSEAYYRMRARDFVLSPYSPIRDSINHAFGVRQFFSLGARTRNLIVGYRYDADVACENVGRQFNYDGHQFELGLEWLLAADLKAQALYAYRLENYSGASANRDDDEHQVMARVEKRLTDLVWLTGSYIFRSNQSDQMSFEYDRHITSLGVEVRY
jgi:tetratricopeptide (TPR) repeat protein